MVNKKIFEKLLRLFGLMGSSVLKVGTGRDSKKENVHHSVKGSSIVMSGTITTIPHSYRNVKVVVWQH